MVITEDVSSYLESHYLAHKTSSIHAGEAKDFRNTVELIVGFSSDQ